VIKVSSLLVLVNNKKEPEHLRAELSRLDLLLGKGECVTQKIFDLVTREVEGLSHFVEAAALQSNANYIFVSSIVEALGEHFVHDLLTLGMVRHSLMALTLSVGLLFFEFSVLVDLDIQELLNILRPLIKLEEVSRIEGKL